MHNVYYKGRIETRLNHVKSGFNTNRQAKLGSAEHPLTLIVSSESRLHEVEALVAEHQLMANITVDDSADENILELEGVLNKPKTVTFEKTPQRNDPCSCGSGKKYKKCCA